MTGCRIICLLSSQAGSALPDGLRRAGADATVLTAYRTQPASAAAPDVLTTIDAGAVSVIAFASPSAVAGFLAIAGEHIAALSGAAFVAIGRTTDSAMRASGLPVHAMASTPGPAGMVEAICRALGGDISDLKEES